MAKREKTMKKCDLCGEIVEMNEICEHCGWEDDDYQLDHPNDPGANKSTLNNARAMRGLPPLKDIDEKD